VTTPWLDRDTIRFLLEECPTWAVVGLSGDPSRTAYSIARLLQERGKRIVPVHPDAPTVLGAQGYARLADIPFPVDVVDVFRRIEHCPGHAREAVDIGARAVWLQLGLVSAEARAIAENAGLDYVENECTAIVHRRL
jgi:predicted CoA-binding protein